MPGIFGVVDLNPEAKGLEAERLHIVKRMAAAMCYEPAYVTEIVSCSALSACAGWAGIPYATTTRPNASSSASLGLLTAGEPVLGNGPGVGALEREFHERGVDALNDLQGNFAGFLLDRRRSQCVLFNDRYGAERLFVHADRSRVFFSSEAKAILAVAPATRAIDVVGLAEWLACGCTIGSRSLFQGIEVLNGGTTITFEVGREAVRTRYFDRGRLEQLPQLSPAEFLESFTDSLGSAVTHAVGRTPRAAISLTGGIDSRLVMACLDVPPGSVPCYTFGSMYRPTMDVSVAQAVAAECDQPHHVLELDRRFLAGIDEHFRQAVYASDGYLGLAGSAELYLNRKASLIAPTRVTGNWGGELMRGVRAFKFRVPKGDFVDRRVGEHISKVGETFRSAADIHPVSYTLFQQLPYQGYGRYAVERSQLLTRSPFLANRVVTAVYQAPVATRTSIELVMRVLMQRPGLLAIPTDTGRLGHSPRTISLLRQSYRRMLVKAEYLTSHGAPDWMAALSSRLPVLERGFLGRDKFQHFRVWMRNELSSFVRDMLFHDDQRDTLAAWFDMRRVSTMVTDHIASRANYTEEIDKVMTVAMLHKTFDSAGRLKVSEVANVHREMASELTS
jgi:asparagine synthase (glutamine-hydrolysing)